MTPTGARRPIVTVLLIVILVYGGAVRWLRKDFGLPYLHHWDEPMTMNAALHTLTSGDFNPHFFNYPGLLIYANLGVAVAHYYYLMGQRPDAPRHMESLDDLHVGGAAGYYWEVSHPSFYAWGRGLTVILGLASILVTFLLGEAVGGSVAGLFAAAVLSMLSLHVAHSTFITTDVPMGCFALLAVASALRYAREGRLSQLAWSGAWCGATMATKYNGLLVLVAPAAALLVRRAEWARIPARGVLLVAAALGIFLLFDPYVLLDFATFMRESGYEIHHYKVLGHGGATSVAGLPNFRYQLSQVLMILGPPLLLLAAAGCAALLLRPATSLVLLSFPALYTLFMCQQKANFHRNFVAVYPFLAIGAGVAAASLMRFGPGIVHVLSRGRTRPAVASAAAPALLCVLLLSLRPIGVLGESLRIHRASDTRAAAIDAVNRLVARDGRPDTRIGLSEQLHFHPIDQRRLTCEHQELHQADGDALRRFDYLLVTRIAGGGGAGNDMNHLLEGAVVVATMQGTPPKLNQPMADPLVLVIRPRDGKLATLRVIEPAAPEVAREGFYDDGTWTNGAARLRNLHVTLAPGTTTFVVETGGGHPRLRQPDAIGLKVKLDGVELRPRTVAGRSFVFDVPADKSSVELIELDSATFTPPARWGKTDRLLGIDVKELRFE